MMVKHNHKNRWLLPILLIVLAASILALSCVNICPLIKAVFPSFHLTRSGLAELIQSLGGWGVVASVGLMVLHSFIPFPAELLAMANGMVYGPFWGTVVTWIGAMLGAYASFGLTRRLGRPFVKRIVDEKKLDKIDRWTKNRGNLPLLLSRLIPLIAFNLINYAAGLTRISWWSFTWTTGIGILPMTILMAAMGNSMNILPLWAWILLLVFLVAAVYGFSRLGPISDFKLKCIRRYFPAFFFLIFFVASFHDIRYLWAEVALPPDAVVEKVVDLGIIETAPVMLGRDGGYSALFQKRSIWIFGDTIISQGDYSAPTLLSNSCSWTTDRNAGDGLSGFRPCQGSRMIPQEFYPFTPEEHAFNRDHQAENCPIELCGARWALWPGAVISDTANNRLVLFFKKVLVKPGVLNFQTAGHGIAVWHRFSEPPERIRNGQGEKWPDLMFGETEPAFGSAAIVVESVSYVFGCSLDGNSKPCRLARVPLANITDRRAWQFYGASQKWQKEIDDSKVVFDGNDMMSVSYNSYLKRFLAVYSQPMGTGVLFRTAINIEGPWSAPLKAFDAIPPANNIGWIYDAMEHPEYAQKNGSMIYITYSRQSGPLSFEMRLVAVSLQKS